MTTAALKKSSGDMVQTFQPSRGYRWYVLGLFTLVYMFNYIDRQIITILAPYLKADLGLADAQIGLLYGTAFAFFFALFAIPLAKLADGWSRVRTVAVGLSLWSAMTALSGAANNFTRLGLARMGVGIGEASASPAAYSLLQDYFPKSQRATAFSIYSSGAFLGSGVSLMIGGGIVAFWDRTYQTDAPFGLAGWQAAFLAVGIPGLLLALIVALTVREPVRGAIDGHAHPGDPHPFRATLREFGSLFPPFTLLTLWSLRARQQDFIRNILLLAACAFLAFFITDQIEAHLHPTRKMAIFTIGSLPITTHRIQWLATMMGVYAVYSWAQTIQLRDLPASALLLRTASFHALNFGGGLICFGFYGVGAFTFLYGHQYVGLTAKDGLLLGTISAIAGGIGTVLGGVLADQAWRRHPSGRLFVAIGTILFSASMMMIQFTATDRTIFFLAHFGAIFSALMWMGPSIASCQSLMLPRLRGLATAVQSLGSTLIGLGLGPYTVGLISDASGSLRIAIVFAVLFMPLGALLFVVAARKLPRDEATLLERARAAGEPIG
jgi:MFS family permease